MLHFHPSSTSSQARNSPHNPATPFSSPLPFSLGPACQRHFVSSWKNCGPMASALGLLPPPMCWGHQGGAESRFQAQKSHVLSSITKHPCKGLKILPDPAALYSSLAELVRLGLNQVAKLYSRDRGVNLNTQLCQNKSQAHIPRKMPCWHFIHVAMQNLTKTRKKRKFQSRISTVIQRTRLKDLYHYRKKKKT